MKIIPRISKVSISVRVHSLAKEITKYYSDSPYPVCCEETNESNLVLVGVLKGCVPFIADLSRWLEVPHQIDYMRVRSYKGTQAGVIEVIHHHALPLAGRDVLIVEDIIDTGATIGAVIDEIQRQDPASIEIVALLSKQAECRARFHGFDIDPKEFVVGYGLDYDERYRDLHGIGVIDNAN